MARMTAMGMALATALVASPVTARAAQCPDKVNANGPQNVADKTLVSGVWTATDVQLNASGNFDTYAWSQTAGPAATIVPLTSDGQRVHFAAPDVDPAGASVTFQVVATAAGCPSRSGLVTINVTNVVTNRPPVARATASPSISDPEGTPVTLDGSASSDPDGDTLTYSWVQTGGPSVSLAGGTTATATFTTPDVGPAGATLEFQLTVSDGALVSNPPATVTVNVTWVNVPPVAVAACPATVKEGDLVTLDGSGSGDVDDGIVAYEWRQTFGTPIPDLTDPKPVATYQFAAPPLVAGLGDTRAFQLKVTDASGAFTLADCSVKVLDVTAPALLVPGPITAEATGAAGAAVTFTVGANDGYDGDVSQSVVCSPASGSVFALGTTTVSCTAQDAAGNEGAGTFTVTVQDTTPPALTLPEAQKLEATGPGGAAATFAASASDLVDGVVPVSCTPASGTTFPLGTTTVTCSAEDARRNKATGSFTVEVVDTTPPKLTLPAKVAGVEATGQDGAAVTFAATASDLVDGTVAVTCTPKSGDTFALGPTAVTCSAEDAHHNKATGSFTVEVVDTTPPKLQPADVQVEATGPDGAVVNYGTIDAIDLVDGSIPAACVPASGTKLPLGVHVVTCSATDAHGNSGTGSFKASVVDTTPPTVTVPASITTGPTLVNGATATFSASAADLVDGLLTPQPTCSPASGSVFPFGTTQVTCSSTDAHGNTGTGTFTVTVTPFTFDGYYQPIDNNGVVNTVKGGATVPVKWRLFGQGVEIRDTAAVDLQKLRAVQVNCLTSAEASVEVTTTGGTSLRYDATGMQFVLNWQTPKQPGTCWRLEVGFVDGAAGGKVQTALFKLK